MSARPPLLSMAILGVPQAGKSTLFSALSGIPYEKILPAGAGPLNAQVRIPDSRLEWLHKTNEPQAKLTYPTVELIDTPALTLDDPEARQKAVGAIREPDALIAVLKAYDLEGSIEAKRAAAREELEAIRSELHLIDLEKVQRRIEKLGEVVKKPVPDVEAFKRELEVLRRLFEEISSGRTDAFRSLSPDDERKLRAFQFFSRRSILAIANIADTDAAEWKASETEAEPEPLPLKLELDLMRTPEPERAEFLQMYGRDTITLERWLERAVRRAGRILFYTVGDKEVAGWGILEGTTARAAAGKIHSDMEEGFIAAEVVPFEAASAHGTVKTAVLKTRPKPEGKEYVVRDGDILHFKFSP